MEHGLEFKIRCHEATALLDHIGGNCVLADEPAPAGVAGYTAGHYRALCTGLTPQGL